MGVVLVISHVFTMVFTVPLGIVELAGSRIIHENAGVGPVVSTGLASMVILAIGSISISFEADGDTYSVSAGLRIVSMRSVN